MLKHKEGDRLKYEGKTCIVSGFEGKYTMLRWETDTGLTVHYLYGSEYVDYHFLPLKPKILGDKKPKIRLIRR